MSDSDLTLRSIFALPPKVAGPDALENWPAIKQGIIDDFKGINWTASMPGIAPKIDELFDIEIPGVFVTAWNKASEIQKAREESRHSPEEILYVELAEHSITSEHRPYVEMRIKNTMPMKIVELTVKLTMTLKGIQLKLQQGEITEIGTGVCHAKGTIEYKGVVLKEEILKTITLPGVIRLTDTSSHSRQG